MKSQRYFNQRSAICLAALILIIFGCSKDNGEVIPPDNNEHPPVTSITETIGSEGGTIALDSIIISIPAGAFEEDQSLTLAVDTNPTVLIKTAVTSAYKLEGLPDEFSKPIGLKLKYQGSLEGESYISKGRNLYSSDLETTFFSMNLIICQDSSGYLTGNLLPYGSNANGSRRKSKISDDSDIVELWFYLLGVTSFSITESNYFDTIIYNSTLDPAFANKVGYHLDDIYEIFTDAGFNDNFYPAFKLPIGRFKIFDERSTKDIPSWMEEKPLRSSNTFKKIFDNPDFTLWTISYFSDEELRQMIGKEYLQQFLFYIEPYEYFDFYEGTPFNNSVRYWLEEKWSLSGNSDNFVPSYFSKTDFKLYLDLFSFGSTNCEVIKYLVEKYGEDFIRRYYIAIQNGSSHFPALSHCVDDPIKVWLPEYFRKLFLEDIYKDTKTTFVEKILNSNSEYTSYHFLPLTNQTSTHTAKRGDLSARAYHFDTGGADFNENSILSFSISSDDVDLEDLHGLLFSIDMNNEITFLEEGANITISDPIYYKDENLDFFIVIVNSHYANVFNNESTIQLDVNLKEVEVVELNYRRMRIDLDGVNITRIYNDDRTETYENVSYQFSFPSMYTGSFSNNKDFTGNWDYVDGLFNYWGEVKATVNPESLILEDFDFKQGNKYSNSSGEHVSDFRQRITGINVQLEQKPGLLTAKIQGTSLIQYINIFDFILDYVDPEKNQTDGYYIEIDFTEYSELEIAFYDEN